mmetsp:Transcript_23050/g.36745  ORF Transcript_23050/g.36745 Transcript_23050/m.36745 type:complete len:225 (-) Transcript_23050:241-915(-)
MITLKHIQHQNHSHTHIIYSMLSDGIAVLLHADVTVFKHRCLQSPIDDKIEIIALQFLLLGPKLTDCRQFLHQTPKRFLLVTFPAALGRILYFIVIAQINLVNLIWNRSALFQTFFNRSINILITLYRKHTRSQRRQYLIIRLYRRRRQPDKHVLAIKPILFNALRLPHSHRLNQIHLRFQLFVSTIFYRNSHFCSIRRNMFDDFGVIHPAKRFRRQPFLSLFA